MAKKLKVIDDIEPVIKKHLITQNTLARALGMMDADFTRKMKHYGNRKFTVEEAQIMEKILNVKLTEPDVTP